MIGKLRLDANMRYLYTGSQKPKGARRKYDGKVDLTDLTHFTLVETLEPHRKLYTAVVWHVSLKCKIRLTLLVNTDNPAKPGFFLLFSTDIALDAQKILEYYHSRFQIEILQPQCPHKSETIDDQAASTLTVFRGTSEHSVKTFKGIRKGQLQWVAS
jgi:hypothetical protein